MSTQDVVLLITAIVFIALVFYVETCKCEIIKHIDKKFDDKKETDDKLEQ